jgi:hypothetical protein
MGMAHSSAAVIKHPDEGALHDAAPSHGLLYAPFDHSPGEGGTPPLRPCGMSAHRLHGFGRFQAFSHIW